MIETNAIALADEAKEIPKLLQIHIEVLVLSDKTTTLMYKETFSRKQDDQKFSNLETAVNRKSETSNEYTKDCLGGDRKRISQRNKTGGGTSNDY